MDIIYEIQRIYNSFSDKEKSIADYIMQNRESIKNINITDLAKVIGTSGATITRFAKKIGCNSFVDMKIMLGSNKMEKVVEDDDEIFSYTYQYYNEVIERTKMLIDKRTIFKVVDELKKARSIYIYIV